MAPRPCPVAGYSSCGGGDTQWARAGEAARNSAREHSSFRNTGDSAGLAETRLFGKQPQLWENTSWLRSLLSISLLLLKSLKTKKKKRRKKETHIFREKVLFFTRPELRQPLPHCTRSVKFSGKTPRHFSSSLCWFQSVSFTPMSQPSSCSSGFWKGITSTTSPAFSCSSSVSVAV